MLFANQKVNVDLQKDFDHSDYYIFYVVNGFKVYYTESRSFKQSLYMTIDKEVKLHFSTNENSHFDVDEQENGRRILTGGMFIFGQRKED